MPLTRIEMPDDALLAQQYELPPEVEALIAESERRIESFLQETRDTPMPAFVPSEFRPIWRGMSWLVDQRILPGRTFCEWGSGFGVVAMLAAGLDFQAFGIEVERQLVREAEALADAFSLDVEFAAGSFLPDGSLETPGAMEELDWVDYGAPPAYDEIGYDIDDFDLVFAYPWPGEQHVVYDLFEEHASPGALVLTFHGAEGLLLHRLDRKKRRNRRR